MSGRNVCDVLAQSSPPLLVVGLDLSLGVISCGKEDLFRRAHLDRE